MASSTGIRARVRAELIQEIKEEARRQVGVSGAGELSLRSVARSLGMVSSGIYRYFSCRDDLLTALIIDAYNDLGERVEAADAGCDQRHFSQRWIENCRAARRWAVGHPQEYALVFGSPVPGYRAPEDTVIPASRVTLALASVIRDANEEGMLATPAKVVRLSEAASRDALRIQGLAMPNVPLETVNRALIAWTQLFGGLNFEIFGRLDGLIDDSEAFFEHSVREMANFVGLSAASDTP